MTLGQAEAGRRPSLRLSRLALPLLLLIPGCAIPMVRTLDYDPATLPSQGPSAKDIVLLQSNFNCQYYVDGQPLAIGKRVRIKVMHQPHQIVCKPDGYRSKEEYINPPYDPDSAIGFVFMIEDRLKPGQDDEGPTPKKVEQVDMLASDVDTPKYRHHQRPNDFAVVIGIEKYSQGLPDATYAEHDAKVMRDHLVALGYPPRNITLLTGAQASKAGLTKTIESWLPNHVSDQSTVFFYYSGHGAPDPNTNLAYLVPVDGDPEYLSDTAYPVKRLYQQLNKLPAKQVIVALDSCFSGAGGRSVLAKGTRPLISKVDTGALTDSGRVVALTASGASQISGADDDQRHGLFTYYLLKGLNGAAKDDNGRITVGSLYGYLAPKVEDAAKDANRNQDPQVFPRSDKFSSIELR